MTRPRSNTKDNSQTQQRSVGCQERQRQRREGRGLMVFEPTSSFLTLLEHPDRDKATPDPTCGIYSSHSTMLEAPPKMLSRLLQASN